MVVRIYDTWGVALPIPARTSLVRLAADLAPACKLYWVRGRIVMRYVPAPTRRPAP